jgi:hypothetical protein
MVNKSFRAAKGKAKSYYGRDVSLMDTQVFPRESLDKQIKNPDPLSSINAPPVDQSDDEIVNFVVSDLKRS